MGLTLAKHTGSSIQYKQRTGINTRSTRAMTRTPGHVVGLAAFSSRLRGLKLIPEKRRYLVPPTSGYRLLAVSRAFRKKIDEFFLRECFATPSSVSVRRGARKLLFQSAITKRSNLVQLSVPILPVWKRSFWELCRAQTV